MKRHLRAAAIFVFLAGIAAGQHYKVLSPITQGNLTLFPVVGEASFKTDRFLTLDEGVASGQVIVTERAQTPGLVRPRPIDPGIWRERLPPPVPPYPAPQRGASVNELALVNNSDRPLLLLAGEIVMGGKQDRIVARDRIVPAHSAPVALGVFCVEPHRWSETSARFGALAFSMVQPSVRAKAMAAQDQQQVWNEVAKSRAAFATGLAAPQLRALEASSSYAGAVQQEGVKQQIDSIAGPIEQSYEKLIQRLRAEKAVGAIVAINGQIIWADAFASQALLEKYWPKLIRSYAAEAIRPSFTPAIGVPSRDLAQDFIDRLEAKRTNIETEPGVYRNTEIMGDDFDAFVLTALLPDTGFTVHVAKMRR